MRVVVIGATGNVGIALLRDLSAQSAVTTITGVARRQPQLQLPKTEWRAADVLDADLETLFAGADAVVHLAWAIQPARDRAQTRTVNVEGSARVFEAAARAGVGALVHASSVGVYSPGPHEPRVDEQWPTDGIPSSSTPSTRRPPSAGSMRSKLPTRSYVSCACGPASSSSGGPRRRSDACSSGRSCPGD